MDCVNDTYHTIIIISVNFRILLLRNIMQIQPIVTSFKKVFETRFICVKIAITITLIHRDVRVKKRYQSPFHASLDLYN